MPIQEKDLGKYKRPAIYIEEIDNSIVELPAQDVLINLVPGFSRRGPFNRPIYVDNTVDFERIFGQIDRQLENKGSFFHRTCIKMLETGPIWALNLLSTVPERDVLNYVSISTTSKYSNSSLTNQYTAPFERFFNRQDFWVRDDESFLDVVNDPSSDTERLLHLTNMGERKITVFLFKSDVTGFDVTAREWYNGDDNVPHYIHPMSFISDYMVSVLILSGNWSNYNELSRDTTWSRYFNTDGLIIETLQDFVNERNVNVLGSYDVSLIPNFRDLNNRDLYIKTVINNNTDRTSLFCAYNEDLLLDNDNLTDLIDIIGNTVVGLDPDDNIESINFLSYQQDIKETKNYPLVTLDSPNNVFGNFSGPNDTTHEWNNWTQYGITYDSFDTTELVATFNTSSSNYIINGVNYEIDDPTVNVEFEDVSEGYQRNDVIYLDSSGFSVMKGIETLSGTTVSNRSITFDNENVIILGTLLLTNDGGTILTPTYDIITGNDDVINIDTLTGSTTSNGDYLELIFTGTSGNTIQDNEYLKLRSLKVYEEIQERLSEDKAVIIKYDGSEKTYINNNWTISNTNLSSDDYRIRFWLDNPEEYTNFGTGDNEILLYFSDIQFKLTVGENSAVSTTTLSSDGIIGKDSDFYQDFYNGEINTNDYIQDGTERKVITMYIDDNDDITLNIEGQITDLSDGFNVVSDIRNWKQTVEIADYIGDDIDNIVAIKIDRDRYSEVRRGSYLESNYDEDVTNDRRLVRVINVVNESDTDLKILYTDGPILIKSATDNLEDKENMYTTTYPAIYNYATTLKAISLKPFV
ncbi:MAG: hypothetical protein ACOC2W_04215, partial [bacterium]